MLVLLNTDAELAPAAAGDDDAEEDSARVEKEAERTGRCEAVRLI